MTRPLRLGVVAGEASGDLLGSRVLEALHGQCSELVVEGVGGPLMQARGLNSLFPMDRLSVMGLVEPLKRLPELLRLRRQLRDHFVSNPPDIFLGIDAPDFNLPLSRRLRGAGIRTVHLVSPSVWAWRRGRLRSIAQSVDAMLCLFPFETAIYAEHGIRAQFVGHPMADELGPPQNQVELRQQLKLPPQGRTLALLPGSRAAEVRALAPVFLEAAERLWRERAAAAFILPVANPACRMALAPVLEAVPETMPLIVLEGRAREAMAAADAVLTASGTATLEAALLRRPMVVAYRLGAVSWMIMSRLVQTQFVALPNILSGRQLVPELLQDDATAEKLYQALLPLLSQSVESLQLLQEFESLHESLRCNFAGGTARAVLELVEPGGQRE